MVFTLPEGSGKFQKCLQLNDIVEADIPLKSMAEKMESERPPPPPIKWGAQKKRTCFACPTSRGPRYCTMHFPPFGANPD